MENSENRNENKNNEYYNLDTTSDLNSVNESIDGIEYSDRDYSTNPSSFREMELIKPKKKANEILKDLNKLSNKYDHEITVEKEENSVKPTLFDSDSELNNNFYKRIGNMYGFWFDYKGSPRIVIGPHCK
jgi:hypothetical protein